VSTVVRQIRDIRTLNCLVLFVGELNYVANLIVPHAALCLLLLTWTGKNKAHMRSFLVVTIISHKANIAYVHLLILNFTANI
jgi:hypothetical protein